MIGVKIGKALSYATVVLLLVAMCGLIAYFTSGFTSDFKTFYIEKDGQIYLCDVFDLLLSPNEENRFDVKYTFGALNDEVGGYTVKIVPNISNSNDFDFTVDGEVYSFGAESDLTGGFDLALYDNYFTINGDFTMRSILERLYPEKEIDFNTEDVNWEVDNFILQVYSYNGKALISIGFHNHCPVSGIELDISAIEF
ncbi:MAG: hypothetical protein EOM87_09635 [Clostridia bacterium]|nr:hypothetical protein [Clostridia bacterium]